MDAAGNVMKPEDGYRYSLIAGAYTYRIRRNDSQEETGSFGVGSQDRDIPIYLPQQNANAHLLKELKFISGWDEYDLELRSPAYMNIGYIHLMIRLHLLQRSFQIKHSRSRM